MTAARAPDPPAAGITRTGLVTVLAVAVGGVLGALLRHGVDVSFPVGALAFPWPTLGINLAGSAALAALGVLPAAQRPVVRALLGPGVLGGFTTFSAYAEQGRRLLDSGATGLALGYLLGTLGLCLAGCLAGRLAVTAFLGRRTARGPGRVR